MSSLLLYFKTHTHIHTDQQSILCSELPISGDLLNSVLPKLKEA